MFLFRSRSTAVSESTPEEEKQRQDEGSVRAPSPLVHGRISSEESEAEGPEEPIELPSSAAHPKPVAVSSLFRGLLVAEAFLFCYLFISCWKVPQNFAFLCFKKNLITCSLSTAEDKTSWDVESKYGLFSIPQLWLHQIWYHC